MSLVLLAAKDSLKQYENLAAIRAKLEEIVCTAEPDDGVVLLSSDGPCHYDTERNCQVYDHSFFSPLGDALIELYRLAGGEVKRA